MIDRIFIVEDDNPEAGLLKEYLGMSIELDKIEVITKIDQAYQMIKVTEGDKSNMAIFIDILWGELKEEKGIILAKSIRKEWPKIKIGAYTRIGSDEKTFDRLKLFFDVIVDKLGINPHPAAKTLNMLDRDFLERLSSEDNLNDVVQSAFSRNYIFQLTNSQCVFAQLLVSDFANYSLHDDDRQLKRFTALQSSLEDALDHEPAFDEEMVVLPTGDGLAIGIIQEKAVNPIALKLAFRILESLREAELENQLRIGIHYGRVYLLEGAKGELQLIGTGINKATRVQSASEVGKILVSDEYYSTFMDRSGDAFIRDIKVGPSKEFQIKKEPIFRARFVSKN